MKTFYESLGEHTVENINFKNKKWSYLQMHSRNIYQYEYKGASHSAFNLKNRVPQEIHIVFIMDLILITILS